MRILAAMNRGQVSPWVHGQERHSVEWTGVSPRILTWHSQPHQLGRGCHPFDLQRGARKGLGTRAPENWRCQGLELPRESFTLKVEVGGGLPGIGFRFKLPSPSGDDHARPGLRRLVDSDNADAIAKRHQIRIYHSSIAEGPEVTGVLAAQRHRGGGAQAELYLEPGSR